MNNPSVTLIVDTGTEIIGILSAADGVYTPYRGDRFAEAIERIEGADEIVCFSGWNSRGDYDLLQLGKFSGIEGEYPLRGIYTDMRYICWSVHIGLNLQKSYAKHFDQCPEFPDTYEGNNEWDCYMTWKLWQHWKEGKLNL